EAELERRFVYLPFAPKDYRHRAEDLDNLFQAVAELRPLSCRYPRDGDGALERLEIHPYALLLYKDAIWCLGHDPTRGEVRTLALDHLEHARCHPGEHFELPEGFTVEDY